MSFLIMLPWFLVPSMNPVLYGATGVSRRFNAMDRVVRGCGGVEMNVGLTGLAGSGKTTVAEWLVREHGFKRVSFAENLKYDIGSLLQYAKWYAGRTDDSEGWFRAVYEEDPVDFVNKHKPALRTLLQAYGTAVCDLASEDYWIRRTVARMDRASGPTVIDDCRYPNEAGVLRQRGFIIVRLVRPLWHRDSVDAQQGKLRQQEYLHPSEAGQSAIIPDITVPNQGSLERLFYIVADNLQLRTVDRVAR